MTIRSPRSREKMKDRFVIVAVGLGTAGAVVAANWLFSSPPVPPAPTPVKLVQIYEFDPPAKTAGLKGMPDAYHYIRNGGCELKVGFPDTVDADVRGVILHEFNGILTVSPRDVAGLSRAEGLKKISYIELKCPEERARPAEPTVLTPKG